MHHVICGSFFVHFVHAVLYRKALPEMCWEIRGIEWGREWEWGMVGRGGWMGDRVKLERVK